MNFWIRCIIIIFFFRQLFSELNVIYCIQWPKHYSYVYPSPYSSFSLPSSSRIANGLAERSTCSTLLNSKIQTQGTFYVGKAPFRNSTHSRKSQEKIWTNKSQSLRRVVAPHYKGFALFSRVLFENSTFG